MLQRIISAAIAIPLFILIVCFSPNWLFVLFCLACVLGVSYEFAKLQHFSHAKAWAFALGTVVFAFLLFGIFPQHENFLEYARNTELTESLRTKIALHANLYNGLLLVLGIIGFLIWFLFVPILLWRYARSQEYARHSFRVNKFFLYCLWFFTVGIFFLGLLAITEVIPSNKPDLSHRLALLSYLILIWANDAGAYFVGKSIGKHKFSPHISPNKTWEGCLGGIVVAMLVGLIIACVLAPIIHAEFAAEVANHKRVFIMFYMMIAVPIAIFANIGDLFESMIKRIAGVKDSGNIMPGHGGIYDRIDSWLAVIGLIGACMLLDMRF